MYITLVVPTITQYKKLHRMLATVSEGTRRPDRIVVIDNGNLGMIDIELSDFYGLYDEWDVQPKNLGVAGSCNLAMRLAAQQPGGWWLHANDDIEVGKSTIAGLEKATESLPNQIMFNPVCAAGSAFTLFLMPAQRAIDEIGWWDAEFFPAYFEDNDYAYRMQLKGYRHVDVPCDGYIHHTSSTKRAYTGNEEEWGHQRFRANRQRYIDKWGGPPGEEKWKEPRKND